MTSKHTRPFPGRVHTCRTCGAEFVFARTWATERSKPGHGSYTPIDINPDPAGRVAVRDAGGGVLYARHLAADEGPDTTTEVLGTPHQATCVPKQHPAAAGKTALRLIRGGRR